MYNFDIIKSIIIFNNIINFINNIIKDLTKESFNINKELINKNLEDLSKINEEYLDLFQKKDLLDIWLNCDKLFDSFIILKGLINK